MEEVSNLPGNIPVFNVTYSVKGWGAGDINLQDAIGRFHKAVADAQGNFEVTQSVSTESSDTVEVTQVSGCCCREMRSMDMGCFV